MRVDLNCDVGENAGGGAPDHDADIMAFVTSVSIACGFHAGDPSVMRRTVAAAHARGLAIGAHPSYADREGFGRRPIALPAAAVHDLVLYQLGALDGIARAEGARLGHMKLHGALYNTAARDEAVAEAAVAAVATFRDDLIVVGPPASALADAAAGRRLRFAAEAFADRTYTADGQLTPRSDPRAFVGDPHTAAQRVMRMLREGAVETIAGTDLPIRADTICVHGDNPAALAFAQQLAQALDAAGIRRCPLTEIV